MLSTMVLMVSGWRTVPGQKHHWVTFHVLPELLGKRNLSDYDRAGEITDSEAVELLDEARRFREDVLLWLRRNHPGVAPR